MNRTQFSYIKHQPSGPDGYYTREDLHIILDELWEGYRGKVRPLYEHVAQPEGIDRQFDSVEYPYLVVFLSVPATPEHRKVCDGRGVCDFVSEELSCVIKFPAYKGQI